MVVIPKVVNHVISLIDNYLFPHVHAFMDFMKSEYYNVNVILSPIIQECHYSCKTCFSPEITSCITCFSEHNRIIKGNKCMCKDGYME